MTEPTITDLWEVEDAVWSIEDRQIAIEAAFTALLLTLNEQNAFQPERLQNHLQAAARQIEKGADRLTGAVSALDELTQFVGAHLRPSDGSQGGRK